MGRQCESAVRAQVKVRRHRVQVFYVKNCATIPKIGKRRRVGGWMGGMGGCEWVGEWRWRAEKSPSSRRGEKGLEFEIVGGLCDSVDGDGVERCDHRFGLV